MVIWKWFFYIEKHPNLPDRVHLDVLPRDDSSPQLQNVNWEATNRFNEEMLKRYNKDQIICESNF